MAYYRTCPHCGCNLDPGELCGCEDEKEPEERPAQKPKEGRDMYACGKKELVACPAG